MAGGGGVSAGAVHLLAFLFRKFGIVGVVLGGGALYLLSNFGGGGQRGFEVAGKNAAIAEREQRLIEPEAVVGPLQQGDRLACMLDGFVQRSPGIDAFGGECAMHAAHQGLVARALGIAKAVTK